MNTLRAIPTGYWRAKPECLTNVFDNVAQTRACFAGRKKFMGIKLRIKSNPLSRCTPLAQNTDSYNRSPEAQSTTQILDPEVRLRPAPRRPSFASLPFGASGLFMTWCQVCIVPQHFGLGISHLCHMLD